MELDFLWGGFRNPSVLSLVTCSDFHLNASCISLFLCDAQYALPSSPSHCESLEQPHQEAFLRFQDPSYNIPPWNIRVQGSAAHRWPSVYLLLLSSSAPDWIALSRFPPREHNFPAFLRIYCNSYFLQFITACSLLNCRTLPSSVSERLTKKWRTEWNTENITRPAEKKSCFLQF